MMLVKTVILYEIFKQKCFSKNSCSEVLAWFRINASGGVHLQKSCRNQVFNFAKDRPHLVAPLGILKIFRTTISWTPAVSHFHYYVMARSFLSVTRVFNLYLFRWWHWKMTFNRFSNNASSESSTISSFSCKHKLHLLELQGMYDFYLPLIL